MAESVDAADSKSAVAIREGSSPSPGTSNQADGPAGPPATADTGLPTGQLQGSEYTMPPSSSPGAPARPPEPSPGRLRAWWSAIRPKTLTISFVPVFVGSAVAWTETHALLWLPALVAFCAAMLIQIGTNLHNDVSDFERGADTPARLGPPRATAMGWLPAATVRRAAWLCFALAFNFGVFLAWHGGWPIVAIGLASLVAGWAYTGGPRPIAYSPFGEAFVLAFFGLAAVGGSYFLQTRTLGAAAMLAAVMIGLLAAAVITVNNHRDRETDARAGRRTLAVLLGRQGTEVLYAVEMLLPFAFLPVLAGLAGRGARSLLPVVLLPLALALIRHFRREAPGPRLNALLARTAGLQFLFGLLLGVGLIA